MAGSRLVAARARQRPKTFVIAGAAAPIRGDASMDFGADAYLLSPIRALDLVRVVELALR